MLPGLSARIVQRRPIPLDAEIRCEPGKVLALVGPSGSGKSTLLRCIAGLNRPRQGQVSSDGESWLDTDRQIDLPAQQRRVGFLFQDYALFPHMSALDNVAIALPKNGTGNRRERAAGLLKRVHLGGLEQRRPAALSGGQQQRVALARALARDPRVLLLDEPFSAVDQVTRRKLRMEMSRLIADLNIPVVLVTHDLDEASMLADRITVLHNGTTLQTDAPDKLMRQPDSALVARLIDIRNLFEAKLIDHDPDHHCSRIRWEGTELEAGYCPEFRCGESLWWCIQPAEVLLHRRRQPSRGVRENPVHGIIADMLTVGGMTTVAVTVNGARQRTLYMDLPIHVVDRNSLAVGEQVGVSILKHSLHLIRRSDDDRHTV